MGWAEGVRWYHKKVRLSRIEPQTVRRYFDAPGNRLGQYSFVVLTRRESDFVGRPGISFRYDLFLKQYEEARGAVGNVALFMQVHGRKTVAYARREEIAYSGDENLFAIPGHEGTLLGLTGSGTMLARTAVLPSVSLACELAQRIRRNLRDSGLPVVFSTDPWFPEQLPNEVIAFWALDQPAPSAEEYHARRWVDCSTVDTDCGCQLRDGRRVWLGPPIVGQQ